MEFLEMEKSDKVHKFYNFADSMGIAGLTEKTIEDMMDLGLLNGYDDLYRLKYKKAWLFLLPNYGIKKVYKLLDSIDSSRETTVEELINSLDIPLINHSIVKIIMSHCTSVEDFFDKWENQYDWSNIDPIDTEISNELNHYAENNWTSINELQSQLIINNLTCDNSKSDVGIEGNSFAVVGKFNHYKRKIDLQQEIIDRGGKITGYVSRNTFALITNGGGRSEEKMKKAAKYGVPIWDEEKFIKYLNMLDSREEK